MVYEDIMSRYQKICPTCRVLVSGEFTEDEYKLFFQKGRVAIACVHCRAPIIVGFDPDGDSHEATSLPDSKKIPPSPPTDSTSRPSLHADLPPWPALPAAINKVYDRADEELSSGRDDRPPFELISPESASQRRTYTQGNYWERFYRWFSGLPPWQQYLLLGVLFLLALAILFVPVGPPPKKTKDVKPPAVLPDVAPTEAEQSLPEDPPAKSSEP